MKTNVFLLLGTAITMLSTSCSNSSNSEEDKADRDALKWAYSEDIDKMTSEKIKTAIIASPDVADFKYPYDGGSYLFLAIKKNEKRQGLAVLSIKPAHFTSDYIRVRFDDSEPIEYEIFENVPGDSKMRAIGDFDDFETKLKAADSIKIQAEFYGDGTRVFSFKTKGYKL